MILCIVYRVSRLASRISRLVSLFSCRAYCNHTNTAKTKWDIKVNSALRKCAESFSAARSKYIQALQQKFMHVVTTGRKWKKENVRLEKAATDANSYKERIEEMKGK